jgi:hypothetical protein
MSTNDTKTLADRPDFYCVRLRTFVGVPVYYYGGGELPRTYKDISGARRAIAYIKRNTWGHNSERFDETMAVVVCSLNVGELPETTDEQ